MASMFSWGPSYSEVIRNAEKNLLDSIPWGDAEYSTLDVPITLDDKPHHIHTIVASHPPTDNTHDQETYPIVLWHGYGQGAGSWWRCLPGLAKSHSSQGKVYALDWIGVGASSRPSWTAGDSPKLAEEWFVDTLEQWRIHQVYPVWLDVGVVLTIARDQGYDRIHLVAHSMSAFIATRYAEKYPNRLESLVYASPAGVPHVPEDTPINPRLTESMTRRLAVRTVRHLWTSGHTPQGVVRTLGRWVGKGYIIDGYVQRRFPESVPSKDEFAEYMYQHWQGESSGEQILNALLRFGAYAKEPLCHRIPHLDESIPMCFIYGTHDWMDSSAAKEVKKTILDKTSADQQRKCEVYVVPDCGHQLYIENPENFNEVVVMNCQPRKNHSN